MDWLSDPEIWISLLTLSTLEIVLGIDNIIFITILSGRLPADQQSRARRLGLLGAFVSRVALLFSIAWVIGLTRPLFSVWGLELSGRSLIMLVGGVFLIGKATYEIHHKIEDDGTDETGIPRRVTATFAATIVQIMLVDMVFSLDSVITAVGMSEHIPIMIAANVVALAIMLSAADPIARFVEANPTVKMLALAFLVLIGTNLVAEGFGHHIPKGYTYFAMAFSVAVEMLNLKVKSNRLKKGQAG